MGPRIPMRRNLRVVSVLAANTTNKLEFGFTPTNEKWLGRLAIVGQFSGMAQGFYNGKGMLQQLGMTPSVPIALSTVAIVGSFMSVATFYTFLRYISGDMKPDELRMYCEFFARLPLVGDVDYVGKSKVVGHDLLGNEILADTRSKMESAVVPDNKTPEDQRLDLYVKNMIYLPDTVIDKMFEEKEAEDLATLEAIGARAAMVWFVSSVVIEAATGTAASNQAYAFMHLVERVMT